MKQKIKTILDVFPYGAPELQEVYNKYLAWALLVAIIFQVLGLGGWIGARVLNREPEARMVRMRIIKDIAELGPPPSIAGSPPPAIAVTVPVAKPSIGVPVPVPDAQITEEATIATQQEMAQIQAPLTAGSGSGGDSLIISPEALAFEEEEPPMEAFIPVEVQPTPIKVVEPKYPELARKAGVEGRVFVKALVDKGGKVKRVVVMSGPEVFHEEAKEAAMQWVFKPAIQRDRPIAVWVAIPFVFKLK